MRVVAAVAAAVAIIVMVAGVTAKNTNVHMTYHWHMQQPIYWPAQSQEDPNTYQRAAESVKLTSSQGGHPRNNLNSIFGKADRVNDYQHYPTDAINSCSNVPNMGASVSFSGCLIDNLNSLAAENMDGYSQGWNDTYAKSRTMSTTGGFPKLDLVAFTYHHALMPLIDKTALAMHIAIHKVVYNKTWQAGGPDYSKGIFPAEMAFTERAIPTLVEAGLEWVIVSNSHISRSCKGYPFSPSGDNNDPPNKAYQVNPNQTNYFKESISRGCTPDNAYPYSYRPHYAQHVDPETGKQTKMIVVPAAQAMSWQDGYACYSTQDMQTIASANDPEHPMLIMLAHDGDNSFGGGYTYYNQCVKNLVNEAVSNGFAPTTVDQYLSDFPVDTDDIVGVEDGAWVNADSDFGSPQCINWNWPLLPEDVAYPGDFDIPNGWAIRERSWAIITAAQNTVETAADMAGGVDVAQVQSPGPDATNAEKAWNTFLPSQTSGYMYYGNVLDLPVKPTVASNLAVSFAQKSMEENSSASDTTAPTIWAPQRLPWNPGGYGAGSLWGYKYTPMNTSFYVWTFIYDVSGVSSVTLYVREDADGVNPLADFANEVYEPERFGYKGVSGWDAKPMLKRVFPKGNVYNESIDLTCNSSDTPCLPTVIADEYYLQLNGYNNVLLDYYIEAVDANGNSKKTDIHHVWVGA